MSIRSKKTPVKHQPALRDGRRKRAEGEPRCEPVFPWSSGDFWQCPRAKEMQVLTCMLEELHVHLANLPVASAELLRCAGPAKSWGVPCHPLSVPEDGSEKAA